MCLKLELHDRSSSWSKKQHPASVFNGFCCVVDYDAALLIMILVISMRSVSLLVPFWSGHKKSNGCAVCACPHRSVSHLISKMHAFHALISHALCFMSNVPRASFGYLSELIISTFLVAASINRAQDYCPIRHQTHFSSIKSMCSSHFLDPSFSSGITHKAANDADSDHLFHTALQPGKAQKKSLL